MRLVWSKSAALTWSCLLIMELVGSACWAEDSTGKGRLRASFAHSGGVYVGGCFGGVFGKLNTFRARPDQDINNQLRVARDKGFVNVVQLEYDRRWGGDQENALKTINEWLKQTDLTLVDAVHLSEEQPGNAASWLDPLYEVIKAYDPTLPVYVWPSYALGPMGKADGYLYDAYGLGYMDSRRKLMEFLRGGKPLIMCIDASGYSSYRKAREQLMVCHEFDIPVFYFVAEHGSGSWGGWYGKPTAALSACRNFMFSAMEFQRRCRGTEPITAGDLIWGEQVELAPDEEGKIDYNWSEFGDSTVYGFTRLKLEGREVKVKGNADVAMDYQFWSLLPVKGASLKLMIGPDVVPESIRVEQSRTGKLDEWRLIKQTHTQDSLLYDLGDPGQEFRLRVTLAGGTGAVLRGGHLSGRSEAPSNRAIDLDTYHDGWRDKIQFRQDLGIGLWRSMAVVDNSQHLSDGGSLSLRGEKGVAIGVNTVEKFSSDYPLKNIEIRLSGTSHSALGGSFSLGVSLDGKTIIKQGVPVGKRRADGFYNGTHTLDLSEVPDFQNVREFHVHMNQANDSGVRASTSSTLNLLEIDATRVN